MNGENELNKPQTDYETRNKAIQQLLQDYPRQIKLGVIQPDNEAERLLNLTRADLRRMSAEDCGEAAYILNRMATYIQLESNKIQAHIEWCQQNINFIIAKTIDNVGGKYTPYEYRKILAIANDDTAKKLHDIIVQANIRLSSLSFISTHIHAQAKSLENLQQTKRTQKC